MAWCPSCSYEYVPGTTKCPDCGKPLWRAPGLDEAVLFENREWVAIRAASDQVQAEIMKAFLESHGYEVALRNGASGIRSILGSGTVAGADGIDIMVPVEIAGTAATLLRTQLHWTEEELARYMEEHGHLGDGDEYDDDDERSYLESNGLVLGIDEEDEVF